MKVGEYCKREVVSIGPTAGIVDAARLMRDKHVGFLVVAEEKEGRRVPVGVLTDRDIVVQVNAAAVDPSTVTVGDVMTPKPVIAADSDDFDDLIRGMRIAGIRRAPVVNIDGSLMGVVAADDAIDAVTSMLADICGSFRNEQRQERRIRS